VFHVKLNLFPKLDVVIVAGFKLKVN